LTICRFGDRLAYRELLIALSIIKIAVLRLKTEFSSSYHSEAGGTGVTSGTGGTWGKVCLRWTNPAAKAW